jgi:Polyketide cyclase / dehydrase and lipid transport
MAEYGTSVETNASPEKVWKIWSDMSTWGAWNPNVSTMRRAPSPPAQTGS